MDKVSPWHSPLWQRQSWPRSSRRSVAAPSLPVRWSWTSAVCWPAVHRPTVSLWSHSAAYSQNQWWSNTDNKLEFVLYYFILSLYKSLHVHWIPLLTFEASVPPKEINFFPLRWGKIVKMAIFNSVLKKLIWFHSLNIYCAFISDTTRLEWSRSLQKIWKKWDPLMVQDFIQR